MIANLLTLIAGCVLISVGAKSWPLGIGILFVVVVILNGIGNVMRQLPKPGESAKRDPGKSHPAPEPFAHIVRSPRPSLN